VRVSLSTLELLDPEIDPPSEGAIRGIELGGARATADG
jgi:hypothetical protein